MDDQTESPSDAPPDSQRAVEYGKLTMEADPPPTLQSAMRFTVAFAGNRIGMLRIAAAGARTDGSGSAGSGRASATAGEASSSSIAASIVAVSDPTPSKAATAAAAHYDSAARRSAAKVKFFSPATQTATSTESEAADETGIDAAADEGINKDKEYPSTFNNKDT